MNQRYITRKEAADLAGVSLQTISNWADTGLIGKAVRSVNKRKVIKFFREDVEKMARFGEEYEVKRIDVEEYIKALDEEKRELIDELECVRKDMECVGIHKNIIYDVADICCTIIQSFYGDKDIVNDPLSPREVEVLGSLIRMTPTSDVAKEMGLSRERVRQIKGICMHKITCEENKVDVKTILEQNAKLYKQLNFVRAQLEQSRSMLEDAGINVDTGVIDDEKMNRKLSTSVEDLKMSVRLRNILAMCEIETVAHLVSWPREEIMEWRGIGAKTLHEIDTILEKLKLDYGMDVMKYGFVSDYAEHVEFCKLYCYD